MPTTECKTKLAAQAAIFVGSTITFILSPALWGGLFGAVIGIGLSKPVSIRQGLLWMLLGVLLGVGLNSWVLAQVNHISAFFAAAILSMPITLLKEKVIEGVTRLWDAAIAKFEGLIGGK